jgi:hypothetical protein
MNPAEELEKSGQEARVCTKCELQFSASWQSGEGLCRYHVYRRGPGFTNERAGRSSALPVSFLMSCCED